MNRKGNSEILKSLRGKDSRFGRRRRLRCPVGLERLQSSEISLVEKSKKRKTKKTMKMKAMIQRKESLTYSSNTIRKCSKEKS